MSFLNWSSLAESYAVKYGVPSGILTGIMSIENAQGNPYAVNPQTGASGLFQIRPQYHPGLSSYTDPNITSDYTAKTLAQYAAHYGGNWGLAIAAWFVGEPTADKYQAQGYIPSGLIGTNKISPIGYVNKVLAFAGLAGDTSALIPTGNVPINAATRNTFILSVAAILILFLITKIA